MEKIAPKVMRNALASGGLRWSPILPPENAAEAANGGVAPAPATSVPDAVTVISGPRTKLKHFRDF